MVSDGNSFREQISLKEREIAELSELRQQVRTASTVVVCSLYNAALGLSR